MENTQFKFHLLLSDFLENDAKMMMLSSKMGLIDLTTRYCNYSIYDYPTFQVCLLRTCIENPRLARQIRRLLLPAKPHRFAGGRIHTDNDYKTTISGLLKHANLQPHDDWMSEVRRGHPSIFTALLVLQCSTLEKLELKFISGKENLLLGQIFTFSRSSGPEVSDRDDRLAALKDVKLTFSTERWINDIWEMEVETDIFTDLFYLPHLETISMMIPVFDPITWSRTKPPNCSTLISLDLPECEANEISVAMLLKSTPNLQRLRYDRQINVDPNPRDRKSFNLNKHSFWDLDCLRDALVPLQDTLCELRLAFFLYAESSMEIRNYSINWGVRGKAIDFSQFTQLQTLEVPFQAYLDTDGTREPRPLSPSLRELSFGDDMGEHNSYPWGDDVVLPIIQKLVAEKTILVPKLEFLGLIIRESQEAGGQVYHWDEEERARFLNIGEGAGLRCSVTDASRFE